MDKDGTRHTADNITYSDLASVSGAPLSAIRAEDRASAQRGAQILAAALKAEGVDCLFGYPGGANLEIFNVLEASARATRSADHLLSRSCPR